MRPDAEIVPDPFADLLFTLVAAVLPVILVLLPALHVAAVRAPRAPQPRPEIRLDGARAEPVVAAREGLRAAAFPGGLVARAAIPDDSALRAFLSGLRASGIPLLLIVEPDGLESAFLLEPVTALHGPDAIVQVRATAACRPEADPDWRGCAGR